MEFSKNARPVLFQSNSAPLAPDNREGVYPSRTSGAVSPHRYARHANRVCLDPAAHGRRLLLQRIKVLESLPPTPKTTTALIRLYMEAQ